MKQGYEVKILKVNLKDSPEDAEEQIRALVEQGYFVDAAVPLKEAEFKPFVQTMDTAIILVKSPNVGNMGEGKQLIQE